jgi:hypothetical protein
MDLKVKYFLENDKAIYIMIIVVWKSHIQKVYGIFYVFYPKEIAFVTN